MPERRLHAVIRADLDAIPIPARDRWVPAPDRTRAARRLPLARLALAIAVVALATFLGTRLEDISNVLSPDSTYEYRDAGTVLRTLVVVQVDAPSTAGLLEGATLALERRLAELGSSARLERPAYSSDPRDAFATFRAVLEDARRRARRAPQEIERVAIAGMVGSLERCGTQYISGDVLRALAGAPGPDIRTGMVFLQVRPHTERLVDVVALAPGGPAERAGVRPGDQIKAIDGRDVAGYTPDAVAALLVGQPGTSVSVTVTREGLDRTLELVRETVRYRPLEGELVDGIAHLRFRGIHTQAGEVAALLRRLGPEARGWVLDLRGALDIQQAEAIALVSAFVEQGEMATTVDRAGNPSGLTLLDRSAYRPPSRRVAVLIDERTAFQFVNVVAALQDYRVARVFGERAAPCASFIRDVQLEDGVLQVSFNRVVSPVSRRDLDAGLEPDALVRPSSDPGRDAPLEAALAWLRSAP